MATFYQNVGRNNSIAAHLPQMTQAQADLQAKFYAVSERLHTLYPDRGEWHELLAKMDAEWDAAHPGQFRHHADSIKQREAAIETRLNELDPLREFRTSTDEPADFDPAMDTDLYA